MSKFKPLQTMATMATKRIEITDNSTDPPKSLGTVVFNKDSNGRLTIKEHLPKGISQSLIDSICIAVYIGMKNGTEGNYTWTE